MDTTPRPPNVATPDTAQGRGMRSEVEPDVAAFLAEVRDGYRTELPSDVASEHLRMILAEAAVAPAAPTLRDRGARYARRIAAVGAVKIALTATAAAAAAGTGLAATGSLPDQVQTAVADIAETVGLTLPVPADQTPGTRTDLPGIGEGGVPGLIDEAGVSGDDLPGNTDEAPGLHRGEDGLPDPASDRGASGDDHRGPVAPNAGGDERGAERADDRPAADDAPGQQAEREDPPAADNAQVPDERPVGSSDAGAADTPGHDNAPEDVPVGDGRSDD